MPSNHPNHKQDLPEPKVCFIASLSNGETITEGKGEWCWTKDGRPSPWNRLIRYAIDKKATITSLSLFTPGGATFTIPPVGKARFTGYAKETTKPLDYQVGRHLIRDMDVGAHGNDVEVKDVQVIEFYTYAEAIYADFSIQLWVNELNPLHSWVVYKKL